MAATGARIRVPVAVACRVLGLSAQGYYKWRGDPVSQRDWDDAHLINMIREIHEDDATLGYRFISDELADLGIIASENRVWRLCSIAGVFASHHRRRGKSGKPGPAVHDDLLAVVDKHGVLRHEFTAAAPNEVWLTDIQCRCRHRTSLMFRPGREWRSRRVWRGPLWPLASLLLSVVLARTTTIVLGLPCAFETGTLHVYVMTPMPPLTPDPR